MTVVHEKVSFIKISIFLILASVTIMLSQGILTHKIQIADVVFLLVFMPFAVQLISERRPVYWSPFIKPIGAYVLLAALSIFVSLSIKTTAVEFIGICYLTLLFLLWINIVNTEKLLNYAVWCWIINSVLVSIVGLYGIILAYGFNINNPFVTLYKIHPYINNLYCVHSTFFQNEKFFSSYLLISVPLTISMAFYEKRKKVKYFLLAALLLFSINIFFTYSRSLIGILSAVYIVIFRIYKNFALGKNTLVVILKITGVAIIIILWIVSMLVSHIQFLGLSSRTATIYSLPDNTREIYYYRPDIGIKQTDFTLRYNYSYYLFLKKYALKMFAERPLMGVGNGAFLDKMKIYENEGKVPKDYLLFDPHSMYLGSLAENGILGFCVLIFLWSTIILKARRLIKDYSDDFIFYMMVAFYGSIIGFFIQATEIDIMNFRFLWLLFGFTAIGLRLYKPKIKIAP